MLGSDHDAVVIGGGFYGSIIAIYLAKERGFKNITIIEREPALMTRASYNNQARVHNGYHYPRSFTTAYRSRVNFPKFLSDWPQSITQDFIKLYAISRKNSKVTSKQFERFCSSIGAPFQHAHHELRKLFQPQLIEEVYQVSEWSFNTTALCDWALKELGECGVGIRYNTRALSVSRTPSANLQVTIKNSLGGLEAIRCRYVFNCAYSGLNQFKGDFRGVGSELKQEITEMALLQMPNALKGLGVTVMDGPFFSMMPFPARGLHTLSHVRYTPHQQWRDHGEIDPYKKLATYSCETRVDRMVRDVSRYLPTISEAIYKDSLFEIKTVLAKNESDDGRPILFKKHPELPGCYSVLGGKIDNVYDVLERLRDFPHD